MFKEQIIKDLEILFNISEFAKICYYKNKQIPIIWQSKDVSFFDVEFETLKAIKKDVKDIELGDILTIDSFDYKVTNFTFKDEIAFISFVRVED